MYQIEKNCNGMLVYALNENEVPHNLNQINILTSNKILLHFTK